MRRIVDGSAARLLAMVICRGLLGGSVARAQTTIPPVFVSFEIGRIARGVRGV